MDNITKDNYKTFFGKSKIGRIKKVQTDITFSIAETFIKKRTLCIKAGSKVYVPRNTSFDTIIIPTDKTIVCNAKEETSLVLFYIPSKKVFKFFDPESIRVTDKYTFTDNDEIYYNPTDNRIRYVSGKNKKLIDYLSLPIAVVSCKDGNVLHIDTACNGIIAIDDCMFMLPGLEISNILGYTSTVSELINCKATKANDALHFIY